MNWSISTSQCTKMRGFRMQPNLLLKTTTNLSHDIYTKTKPLSLYNNGLIDKHLTLLSDIFNM